ncbi:MAG: glycine betaine ABC transporter substrate-binding protein, partial [Candidatus Eremiobacterota bacterium]
MRKLLLAWLLLTLPAWADSEVRVGSKAFPESWILGDALTLLARGTGARVEHKDNLGATQVAYEALLQGSIDVYPEYTGTVAEVFLKHLEHPSEADMLEALAADGIGMSYPLGFNDSYGLALREEVAARLGLERVSQLAQHPELEYGLTPEFVGRKDGWPGLKRAYGLQPRTLTQ